MEPLAITPATPVASAAPPLRLTVIHWLPLEQFPPARNLLEYFAADSRFQVVAGTSIRTGEQQPVELHAVTIRRAVFPAARNSRLKRLWQFAALVWLLLLTLFTSRPDAVLYIEPHSALPVAIYLLFNRSARLLIHYHEYRELSHYRDRGNAIARLGHWLECRFLYRRTEWISHTNQDRIRMFLEDHPWLPPGLLRAMPNYPPKSWLTALQVVKPAPSGPLRLVYVGALSLHDTFIRPLVEWVVRAGPERVQLDLYAGNLDRAAKEFIEHMTSPAVRFFPEGLPYLRLPPVLATYDVGLILYRGNTRNYKYNAPNKLFEYLLCGLDVWYPRQMPGIRPVAAELRQQRVLELDFEQPEMLDQQLAAPRRSGVREWDQTCAAALQPMRDRLLQTGGPCN